MDNQAYNNGFILGMASKGVIQKTIIVEGELIKDYTLQYSTVPIDFVLADYTVEE